MVRIHVYRGVYNIGYEIIADTDTKRFTIIDPKGTVIGDDKFYLWQAIECVLQHWLDIPKKEKIRSFRKNGINYDEDDIHRMLATDVATAMFFGRCIK